MRLVNVQQAKTQLSRLLADAVAGEEIVIAKAGRPQVRLVPCVPEGLPRVLGAPTWTAKGKVWVATDFDDLDDRITSMFEGSEAATRSKPLAPRLRRKR